MRDESSPLLIQLFERLPPHTGFSIDEASGYNHNITAIFGISQYTLDVLLHQTGILVFKKAQRCYKLDAFDGIKHHFSLQKMPFPFQAISKRFKNSKGCKKRGYLVGFGNLTINQNYRPIRIVDGLLQKIDAFCAQHPIPEFEEQAVTHTDSILPQPIVWTVTPSTTVSNTIAKTEIVTHILSFLQSHRSLQEEPAPDVEPAPPQLVAESFKLPEIVTVASQLDFTAIPRRKRSGDGIIPLHDGRQLQPKHRRIVVDNLSRMGYDCASPDQRKQIKRAALNLVCYDFGFRRPACGITRVLNWEESQGKMMISDQSLMYETNHKGRTSLIADLEMQQPQYVITLFREAVKLIGATASFHELALKMNELSRDREEPFEFNRKSLAQWFRRLGGKERSGRLEKPVLTQEHMEKRVEWAQTMQTNMADKVIVHLDEKWFYCNTRRKKYKDLGLQHGEEAGADELPIRRVVSRQHPTKVMFMGIIAKPNMEHGFDGKVDIIRISKSKEIKQTSYRQMFVIDRNVNDALRNGAWRELFGPVSTTLTIGAMVETIIAAYDLDDELQGELVFRYSNYNATVTIDYRQPNRTLDSYKKRTVEGTILPVQLEDLNLYMQMIPGRFIEEDCSCDSTFMRNTIPTVGERIREAFHWLPQSETIYLQMDNAGGHGTKHAVAEYTRYLDENYNIKIIHQPARSPDTNVLDLGLWYSLQTHVERKHRSRVIHTESLARSARDAWDDLSAETIRNVFGKLPDIWDRIIASGGQEVA
jgi:hypothetical protein